MYRAMYHQITVHDVLVYAGIPILVVLGAVAICAVALVVVSIFNPFRSGH